MPAANESDPIRQGTDLTLASTLQQVLAEFVTLDAEHQAETPDLIVYDNALRVVWEDTSQVLMNISVMSASEGAVAIIVPPYVEVPSGENPNNPPPEAPPAPAVVSDLSPATLASGGADFLLTINGTGFVDGSTVNFGTAFANATLVSPTQVTATIPAAAYAAAGTLQVSVTPPGGTASNQLPFTAT